MRKIIDGKTYNTETARLICDVSAGGYNRGDWHYDDTILYLTKKGQFFIAGHGGPLSRWGQKEGQSGMRGGEGLALIDKEDAREMFERHGDANYYQEFFGEPEEG